MVQHERSPSLFRTISNAAVHKDSGLEIRNLELWEPETFMAHHMTNIASALATTGGNHVPVCQLPIQPVPEVQFINPERRNEHHQNSISDQTVRCHSIKTAGETMKWLVPFLVALGTLGALAEAVNPPTLMTERGTLVYSSDLNAPFDAGWKVAKGDWKVVDGVLNGTQLAADNHGAVARYAMTFKDIIIQYDVKLGAGKATSLSINDAKGHICRITLTQKSFTATKDDHDHDGPNEGVKLGTGAFKSDANAWHTVLLELQGSEMLARVDDQVIVGQNPEIDVAKANFGLTVSGDGVQFRNLRVWEALPNASWAETRAKIMKP